MKLILKILVIIAFLIAIYISYKNHRKKINEEFIVDKFNDLRINEDYKLTYYRVGFYKGKLDKLKFTFWNYDYLKDTKTQYFQLEEFSNIDSIKFFNYINIMKITEIKSVMKNFSIEKVEQKNKKIKIAFFAD